MVAGLFGPSLFVFGASMFILGLLCAIARSDRGAYRFAGVTPVVLLIPRANPVWQIAVHRFAEVSIGIASGTDLGGGVAGA
jgi:Fusaric acid resistance protein-like